MALNTMKRIWIQKTVVLFVQKPINTPIVFEYFHASKFIQLLCIKQSNLIVFYSHEFHKNCIDPWLIEHRTCPMCKLDVLKFYGYIVGDLTIEHIGTPTPVQFVHLEIPTDSPQLPARNFGATQHTSFVRSSNSSSNSAHNSITLIDNCNTTASHQVTEV